MKSEEAKKTLSSKGVEEAAWSDFGNVDRIVLKNGRVIFPDQRHTRFYVGKKAIYIRYGNRVPYGARLSADRYVTWDGATISFQNARIFDIGDPAARKIMPFPRIGNFIIVQKKSSNIKAAITKVGNGMHGPSISIFPRLQINPSDIIYFYDALKYSDNDFDGDYPSDGIYSKFIPVEKQRKFKEVGTANESISFKEIAEIS